MASGLSTNTERSEFSRVAPTRLSRKSFLANARAQMGNHNHAAVFTVSYHVLQISDLFHVFVYAVAIRDSMT